MTTAIGLKAFRAQLIVPEQRQLFDYWLEAGGASGMPSRSDINPAKLPRILPGISLIEVADKIENCRIRLAGTRLREVHDREITGLTLGDMAWGEKRGYWHAAYARTIHEGLPSQGVLRGPMLQKEHVVQYWLMLPLRTNSRDVGMVICHDLFIPASELLAEEQVA